MDRRRRRPRGRGASDVLPEPHEHPPAPVEPWPYVLRLGRGERASSGHGKRGCIGEAGRVDSCEARAGKRKSPRKRNWQLPATRRGEQRMFTGHDSKRPLPYQDLHFFFALLFPNPAETTASPHGIFRGAFSVAKQKEPRDLTASVSERAFRRETVSPGNGQVVDPAFGRTSRSTTWRKPGQTRKTLASKTLGRGVAKPSERKGQFHSRVWK